MERTKLEQAKVVWNQQVPMSCLLFITFVADALSGDSAIKLTTIPDLAGVSCGFQLNSKSDALYMNNGWPSLARPRLGPVLEEDAQAQ